MYKVKIETFEGPLDLLLELIENEKLDITEVSLSAITDKYLSEVSKLDPKTYDVAEFMVVAAKLLYLKSKALLPSLATQDEEEEIEDLKQKLELYKKYRDAAKEFGNILDNNQRSFSARTTRVKVKTFVPPKGVAFNDLFGVFNKLLKDMPVELTREEVELPTEKVTVESKLEQLDLIFKKDKKQRLSKLIKNSNTKVEAIVTFLAILEMIKCKILKVSQNGNFKEIDLIKIR